MGSPWRHVQGDVDVDVGVVLDGAVDKYATVVVDDVPAATSAGREMEPTRESVYSVVLERRPLAT
jgi:hypothetical protein